MSWIPGWDSIEGAGWWSTFYFWIGIGSLLCLGVSEVISHRYTERKDELTEAAQIKLQRLHDDDVARLQHATSQANERAAQLEGQAEKDRIARLKLEAELAPRRLSSKQQATIAQAMKPFAGKVVRLESYSLDAEGAVLAAQIRDALREGGIRVDDGGMMTRQSAGSIVLGIQLSGRDEPLIDALNAVFAEASLSPSRPSPPTGGVYVELRMGSVSTGVPIDATAFVGVKPVKR